jgi:hypothetical protein
MQGGLVDVREAIADLRAWMGPYRRHEVPPPLARLYGLPIGHPSPTVELPSARTSPSPSSATLEEVQAIRPFPPPPQVA